MLNWDINSTTESSPLPPVWKKEHIHYTNSEYSKLKEQEKKKEKGQIINFSRRDSSEDLQILPKNLAQFTFESYSSYIEVRNIYFYTNVTAQNLLEDMLAIYIV
jgi:hypothetical protein